MNLCFRDVNKGLFNVIKQGEFNEANDYDHPDIFNCNLFPANQDMGGGIDEKAQTDLIMLRTTNANLYSYQMNVQDSSKLK